MTFLLPSEREPPLGTRLLILTWTGSITIGRWDCNEPELAWAPLPEITDSVRDKLSQRWIKK